MCFSILSVNGPLNEKRFRWMSSTGGSRESDSVLVALRSVLHRGQFLIGGLRWARKRPHYFEMTYHASAFSITSVLTKASRHCCMSTLLFLVDGIGKDKYMKLLYVVDVY